MRARATEKVAASQSQIVRTVRYASKNLERAYGLSEADFLLNFSRRDSAKLTESAIILYFHRPLRFQMSSASKCRSDRLAQIEKRLRLARTADPQTAQALRAMALEHETELERLHSKLRSDHSEQLHAEVQNKPHVEG
jgi:hypothetical protein